MAVDFPSTPKLNERFDAPNGVTYSWDGVKWSLNVSSEDVINYWSRNAVTEDLQPKSFNDTIVFSTLAVGKLGDLP